MDRDGDDRRAGFEGDPPQTRLDLAQLAAARAPPLGVDQQHFFPLEDRVGGREGLLVVVAPPHREDPPVRVDVGEHRRPEEL